MVKSNTTKGSFVILAVVVNDVSLIKILSELARVVYAIARYFHRDIEESAYHFFES